MNATWTDNGMLIVKIEDERRYAMMKGEVEGEEVKMMLDYGASVSLVEEDVKYIKERKTNININYANGVSEKVNRERLVKIILKDGFFLKIWCLVLKKLPTRIILGWSYLKNNVVVNGKVNEIYIMKNSLCKSSNEVVNNINKEEVRKKEGVDYNLLVFKEGKGAVEGRWRELAEDIYIKFKNKQGDDEWLVTKEEPIRLGIKEGTNISPSRQPMKIYGKKLEFAMKKMKNFLDRGVCHVSSSRNPVNLLVVEDDSPDGYRLCFDYRPVNTHIKPDEYIMPDVRKVSRTMSGINKTQIDVKTAHMRRSLYIKDWIYTAFRTPFVIPGYGDTFEFKVMAWGLRNSGREFQRMIEGLLRAEFKVGEKVFHKNLKGEGVEAFQDNILASSDDEDKHYSDVKEILERMLEYNLMPNWDETIFCTKEIRALGMIMGEEGVRQNPDKVKGLLTMNYPNNRPDLIRFLSMAGYHRTYIEHLSQLLKPLEDLRLETRNKKYYFNDIHKKCFDKFKQILSRKILLNWPIGNGEFIIYSDFCQITGTVSGVLYQNQNGNKKLLGYASRKLTPSELNKGVPFGELLSIHYTLSYFTDIVMGHKIIVYNDQKGLSGLNLEKPVGRWLSILRDLLEYEINGSLQVKAIRGENNIIADTLTRLRDVIDSVEISSALVIESNMLKKKIINNYHHHFSDDKTLQIIRKRYNWDGIVKDIEEKRLSCDYCLRNRNTTRETRPPLTQIIPKKPNEILGLDYLPNIILKNGERKNLGIVVDYFTDTVYLFVMETLTAVEFLEKLEKKVFDLPGVGIPNYLVGDNCKQFLSEAMKLYEKKWNLQMRESTSFHQQTNGKCENKVKMVKKLIHSLLDYFIPFRKAIRETLQIMNKIFVSDVTKCSPFEIMNGETYETVFDRYVKNWIEKEKERNLELTEQIAKAKLKQKKNYDKNKKIIEFNVGDIVYAKNHYNSSFSDDARIGPFEIDRKLENFNYVIRNTKTNKSNIVNQQFLMKYIPSEKFNEEDIIKTDNDFDRMVDTNKRKNINSEYKPEYEEKEKIYTRRSRANLEITPKMNLDEKRVDIGDRIEVFWDESYAGKGQEGYYKGEIVGKEGNEFLVLYDDEKEKGRMEPILEDLKSTEWKNI